VNHPFGFIIESGILFARNYQKEKWISALSLEFVLLIDYFPIFVHMAPFLANNLDKTSEGKRWFEYTY